MHMRVKEQNIMLIQNAKKLNEQYHVYAAYCGLSDPALCVLYTLYDADEIVTQNELAVMWCYPKQTINFAISGLVKKGYVKLEKLGMARNSKAVRLTDEGSEFCQRVIAPLTDAEEHSLLRLTEEERELLVQLEQKQGAYFKDEIQRLIKE